MHENTDRRNFLKKTVVTSSAFALTLSLEEKILLAQKNNEAKIGTEQKTRSKKLPTGKIGNIEITRLICGGNLINAFAHSRDLIYVSSLLKSYFTDEKIIETLQIAEQNGINTLIANVASKNTIDIINKYRSQTNGKIQWLAQADSTIENPLGYIKKAIDNGADGVFLIGNSSDYLVRIGRLDIIEKAVNYIKGKDLIAGVAGHNIETHMACEDASVDVDFYMKTLHSNNYWSKRRPNQQKDVIDNYSIDNYWDKYPQKTIDFMRTVKKPWIAYKVLAAGAIHPNDGFRHAFENGADFIVAGMFDFQIQQDVDIANKILSQNLNRQRHWCA